MDIHNNTKWLLSWSERMAKKFGACEFDYDWCRALAYKMGEAGNDHPSFRAIEKAKEWEQCKFGNVHCSNCGKEFGPGNHGYFHCEDHKM